MCVFKVFCSGSKEKTLELNMVLLKVHRTNICFTNVLLRVQRKSYGFTLVLLRVYRKSYGFTVVLLRDNEKALVYISFA